MVNRAYVQYTWGSIGANNTSSKVISVRDFRHLVLDVIVSWTATLTFKVYGWNGDTPPNPASAVSSTNRFHTLQVVDRNSGTNITGSTGVAYAGTSDGGQSYEVNTDGLDWVVIRTSAYTQGAIDVNFHCYDNE